VQFTIIVAALALTSAVTAFPSSTRADLNKHTSALNRRGNLRKRGDILIISSSEKCISIGDDFPYCTSGSYIYTGDGLSSCNDPPTAFSSDFCSASDTIPTPAGDATWAAADGCSDTADDGTPMGTLTAGDTVYNCVRKKHDVSVWCGAEYAGIVHMVCTN
jgi:hypothetical protein